MSLYSVFAGNAGGLLRNNGNQRIHLLCVFQRDALPLYQLLQDRYAAALARDKSFEKVSFILLNAFTTILIQRFEQYLERIGVNYYGVQPQQSGLNSILEMFSRGVQ